ncbi:MAG TPA: TonB-dependent receptor [Bacteroides sp.]|nr:TonB-dependent receptor [Bacteroides sp.]
MIRFLKILAYFALSAAIIPVAAATDADTIHIDGVEIIHSIPVSKAPLISAGMDSISMDLMSGRSLSELLAYQPAIHIKSAGRGALSTASFRGTDASHTKVYWNGIKLNSPMLGQVDFSLIPVWIIDDLSILYGGSSLKEGSGALGGAVLMESSGDWQKPLDISLNQEIASFGTFSTQGRLSAGDDKVRSDTRLYRNHSDNNYPFVNTDILPVQEQQLEQAAFSKGGVLQEIYFRPGDMHELSLRLWYQEATRELPPLMSQEGASREERQTDRNLRTSMEWKMYPGFGTISVRSGYSGSSIHYFLIHSDLDYKQFDSESRENSLYNTIKADLRTGKKTRVQLRTDLNMHDAGINDLVSKQGYQHQRNEAGFMASAHRKFGENWVLYGLIRQEWVDGSWLPVMPSTGFSYNILDNNSLYLRGNLSRNYNIPSLNDLYWIPGGNPDLRPENSINSDLSLEYRLGTERMMFKGIINAFAARVEDWILWKPTRFRYWEAENIASVFSRGFDLQLGADISKGDWLMTLKASYAYTRSTNEESPGTNDQSRGNQLIYIPVHAANGYLNLTRNAYFFNWSVIHTGKRYTQPSNEDHDFTEYLNPYTLHDLHLGKSWNIGRTKTGLRFTVYNLFNTSYQAVRSRPMPMRNYALTINIGI